MKKISFWAKNHIWQSRLIIVLIYILLNGIGLFTGKLLNDINVSIPEWSFMICMIFTVLLWIGYYTKTVKLLSCLTHYFRRKFFEFLMGLVTFLLIIYVGNNYKGVFITYRADAAFNIRHYPKDSALLKNPLLSSFIASIKNRDVNKLSVKEKIRIINHQVKIIKHDNGTTKRQKTLLIILSILIAIILLMGLIGLSCNIACAGSEALAAIIAVGGTFLIIFFLHRVIKRISNPKIKKKEK
jgi:hypothetical protein